MSGATEDFPSSFSATESAPMSGETEGCPSSFTAAGSATISAYTGNGKKRKMSKTRHPTLPFLIAIDFIVLSFVFFIILLLIVSNRGKKSTSPATTVRINARVA
jgi:hypothetical protein